METVSIDITKAKAIDGWMTEAELVWLAERAIEHRCIVEIGSYLGRSTRAMLDHTPGVVYAVDDWKGPRDVYLPKEERRQLFNKFIENVSPNREHYDKLYCCVMDHRQAHLDVKPDMVFIDGGHDYNDVLSDIEIWLPKIIKGGLICGHDIDTPAVQAAVKGTLGDVDVADNTSIWYKEIA